MRIPPRTILSFMIYDKPSLIEVKKNSCRGIIKISSAFHSSWINCRIFANVIILRVQF
jgi:hypothetical protein